jgi:hypothetical protein
LPGGVHVVGNELLDLGDGHSGSDGELQLRKRNAVGVQLHGGVDAHSIRSVRQHGGGHGAKRDRVHGACE